MRYSKSKYPLGATWKCTCGNGKTGTICFSEISDYGWEIWRWSVVYADGTGHKCDWGASYASCRKQIPRVGKFKRVK